MALRLEIVIRGSVTDAAQVQRDEFQEVFSEMEVSVQPHPDGGSKETAKIVVDALRPVAEKLGLRVSIPQPHLTSHP